MAEVQGEYDLGNYNVKLTDKLGQGTFGVVYKGTHKKKKDVVAVKQCEIQSDSAGAMAMKEIKNFQQLIDHPNIVQLFDFHYTKNSFWMFMEFCDAGDLVKYTKRANPDLENKITIMYQASSAIAYMHTRSNPVVHRDIKPANIMMKTEGDQVIVKVTDFGLSKVVEDAPDPGMTMMFSTAAGTPGFMAPEFFNKEKYTSSVDVFAMGLVFLALLDYKAGDSELMPLSAGKKKSGMIMPVGLEMAHYGQMSMPMPAVTEDIPSDTTQVKGIKSLINRMVTYDRKDRMKMENVEEELKYLGGSARRTISVSPMKKILTDASNFELDKSNPRYQRTLPLSETEVAKKSMSSEEGDVGFKLLKEALQHAARDKAGGKMLDKDMPFTSLLHHVLSDDENDFSFVLGDRLRLIADEEELRELQKGHGEWNNHMTQYLGKECTVKEVVLHIVKVQFDDGQLFSFNPRGLRRVHRKFDKDYDDDEDDGPGLKCVNNSLAGVSIADTTDSDDYWFSSRFKRYDVVIMPDEDRVIKALQKNHGGWNARMSQSLGVKGIVNRVDRDGDVLVEFINGDDWTLNPDMLTVVDMTKEKIEAGDFVIVYDDKDKVRRLQEDHGGWVDTMQSGLGKSGIVQSIGNGKAKVETRGRSYIWNLSALVLVAKGEEMLKAVLRKKVIL